MGSRRRSWVLVVAAIPATFVLAFAGLVVTGIVAQPTELFVETERARGQATTPTTDPRTLRGFWYYRATVTVPLLQVYAAPDPAAHVPFEFSDTTEGGIPETFLVEEETRDATGAVWYRVLLPISPTGSTGWVRAADVHVEGLQHRAVVYLSDFRLELYEGDQLVKTYPIGVGTDQTPTPGGRYYVHEAFVLTRSTSAYGSHALGLSGFSQVLSYWRGGGVIGVHGTNKPDSIGTKASHGCIRMRNEDISDLFNYAPRGTPVEIVA